MRIVSVVVVSALMLWMSLRYCWLTIIGETDPVFAGWLVMYVSIGLAFWTYCKTEKRNFIDNICNTVDIVVVSLIIITISIFGQNVRAGFTQFEVWNLILSALVVIFWWRSKDPFISNLATQVLMVIGNIPLITRVAIASENPEPWSVWIPVWFSCVFSMIPAYFPQRGKDKISGAWKDTILPKVYATRAVVSVTILLLLMLRLEFK